jgi:hypothetical protein
VQVSRPSDALEARTKVGQNLQNLLLGLDGVGIANLMVISVLECRGEADVTVTGMSTCSQLFAQAVAPVRSRRVRSSRD